MKLGSLLISITARGNSDRLTGSLTVASKRRHWAILCKNGTNQYYDLNFPPSFFLLVIFFNIYLYCISLKGRFFRSISHCSLRSPNRVCYIGWAENGPGAVLCPLFFSVFFPVFSFYGMLMNI